MSDPAPGPLDTYAVVEAMGHRTAIGRVSEAVIAGKALLRVDRLDGAVQYYPPESLYCLTPCTREQAEGAQKRAYGSSLPYALAELTSGASSADPWGDDDQDDPYTEAGRDYQRAEMAREDRRNEDHDDDDDE